MTQTKRYTFEGVADLKRKAAEAAAKAITNPPPSHNKMFGNGDYWYAYENGVKLTALHRKNANPAVADPPKEVLGFLTWTEVDRLESAVESSLNENAKPIKVELKTVAAVVDNGAITYYNRSASAFFGDGDFLTKFPDGFYHLAWLRAQKKDTEDFTYRPKPASIGAKG